MNKDVIGKTAYIGVDRLAGYEYVKVTIIGVTRSQYHVRLERDAILPGGHTMQAGEMKFVPKTAVRLEKGRG